MTNTYFDNVRTKDLEKDVIDEIINSYFRSISLNVETLNYYFMYEHHKAFITKFEDNLLSFIENKLKYFNYEYNYIILYLLKDVPKVKEYILSKKFISKNEFRGSSYIDSYFIDFVILVFFENTQFYEVFSNDLTIKTQIKSKLEYATKEGKLNDYLESLYTPIERCHNLKIEKNLKIKLLEYFEIQP